MSLSYPEETTAGIIFESSDWHCQPDGLIPEAGELIARGKETGAMLIGCGDLLDLLPLGREKFRHAGAVRELVSSLDGYPFYYVCGNHDPYRWVVELFQPFPNIKVLRRLVYRRDSRTYYFTHGHQWAIDWALLRYVAPNIVQFMVDFCPGLWYRFCKRAGWMASEVKPRVATGQKERQQYDDFTGLIWRNGIRFAQHHGLCVVLGHTHTSGKLERFVDSSTGTIVIMVDGGDLRDGTYVVVDQDARIEHLGYTQKIASRHPNNL